MAFLEKYISDVRSSLQLILLKELPFFLQQKFQLDELEVEKALREFLNGNITKAPVQIEIELSTTPGKGTINKGICPFMVNGEKCGTKIRGDFKLCSKHRTKKASKETLQSENVIIRNDIIKSWIIAQTEFTVMSPSNIIVDGMIKGTGKNIKKIPLTKEGIKKAQELGFNVKK